MDVRTNHRALTIVTTTLRRVFSLGLLPHEGGVMPTTAFDPTVHGFGFDDRFVNVVALLPGGLKLRTKGRCGGMTYAALDYFHLGRGAPTYVPSPPARVPPDRHPLANHLLRRQLESFANDSALRFVTWTLFPDHGLPFAGGARRWTTERDPTPARSDQSWSTGGRRANRSAHHRRGRPAKPPGSHLRIRVVPGALRPGRRRRPRRDLCR